MKIDIQQIDTKKNAGNYFEIKNVKIVNYFSDKIAGNQKDM